MDTIWLSRMCSAFLLPVVLFESAVAGRVIYQWVDEQGRVHYGGPEATRGGETGLKTLNILPDRNVIKSIPVIPVDKARRGTARAVKNPQARALPRVEKQRQARCERAREKLKKSRSRLRSGYRYRQYTRLHAREADYRRQRARYCR